MHQVRRVTTPPRYAIQVAREAALKSPCAKSKRGVVLFDPSASDLDDSFTVIAGEGFNGQPEPFRCAASEACRRDCAKLCLHAEDRAIRQAIAEWSEPPLDDLELLHVKVVDGEVVPGGGPSCWQCSRIVVEVGLRGVWLYETPRCTCNSVRPDLAHAEGCWIRPIDSDGNWKAARWRFYTAEQFHRETLRACGIGDDLQWSSR